MIKSQLRKLTLGLALSIGVLALAACGSTRPKPAELPPIVGQKPVETLWSFQLGEVKLSLVPSFTAQGQVVLATSEGDLLTLQLTDGKLLQKVSLNQRLSAGVGSDGKRHAVVTRNNQLITVADGKEAWRQTLSAQVFTPPLVAGERVFVLLADRTVQAYDGATGRLLWTQSRAGEPLVLSQSGTLMPFGNTLVAGLSGRLTGFDPTTGRIVWEAPMASPRGLNDLERLVDVVGLTYRSDPYLCARAYLSQVACINAQRGQVVWSRTSQGEQGLSGHGSTVVGTESNGLVVAWQRDTGDRLWESDRLKYRRLSAPLVTETSIWLADDEGQLYLLNIQNGQPIHRSALDGSPLASPPVQHQGVVLLVTRKGLVRALRST
jgi:outer membrane assembly lipoprotein YfgL